MDKMFHKLTAVFLSSLMLFNGISVRAEDTPAPSYSPEPTVEASASADATASAEPSAEASATPTPSASAETSTTADAPQLIEVAPDSTAEAGTSEPEQSSNTLTVQRISIGNFTTSFADGPTFNAKVKSLVAGKTVSSSEVDTLVKAIKQSSSAPDSSVTTVDLSFWQNGSIPAWFDSESGTVYWHYIPVKSHDLVLPLELSEDCTSMFSGFTNLTDFDFFDSNKQTGWDPLLGTWGAHALTDMFANCTSLEALDLSNFQSITSESTGVDTMLSGCTSLNKITFGNNSEDTYDPFVLPSTTTGFFPTPTKTASGVISNGKWGKDSEAAETTYSADELTALGKTKDALTGTWYAQAASAKFEAGPKFNADIKALVGNPHPTVDTVDTKIHTVIRSADAPTSDDTTIDVSEAQDGSIVAWWTGFYIKWYSPYNTVLLNEDSSYMFANLSTLGIVEVDPDGGWNKLAVTNHATDMHDMFYGCESLEMIRFLSAFETGNVKDMHEMFSGCHKLNEYGAGLDLSGWDTSKVTNMSGLFKNCWDAAILNVSTWNTSSVTNMDSMFAGCGALSIDASKWNTAKVTDMEQMFYSCWRLNSLDLTGFDTHSVEKMDRMMNATQRLTIIKLGDNFVTLAKANSVFPEPTITATNRTSSGKWGLNSETASKSYTPVQMVSMGAKGDGKLTGTWYSQYMQIPIMERGQSFNRDVKTLATDPQSRQSGYPVWDNGGQGIRGFQRSTSAPDSSYETADISDRKDGSIIAWFDNVYGIIYWYSSAPYVELNSDCSYMFYDFEYMTQPDTEGLYVGNVQNAYGMFADCYQMPELDVSSWNTSNITNMSYMFCGCRELAVLDVSKWDTSKVTTMKAMFGAEVDSSAGFGDKERYSKPNTTLESIDVSQWDVSNVTDMTNMFEGLVAIQTIDLSGWDTAKVTDMNSLMPRDTVSYESKLARMILGKKFSVPSNGSPISTPSATISGAKTDGKWGLDSELADVEYTATELDTLGETAEALTGTWYAQRARYPKLETGDKFCAALKTLAASDTSSSIESWAEDTNIKAFKRSSEKQDKSILAWFDKDSGTIYWYSAADNVLMNEDSAGMFSRMTKLVSADLFGLDAQLVQKISYCFSYDSALTSVNAEILNAASDLRDIGMVFSYCTSLTSVNVSGWKVDGVTYFTYAFDGCTNLEALDISKWNVTNAESIDFAFRNCPKLSALDVSKWNTSHVNEIAGVFEGCSSLTSLDVSKWDVSKMTFLIGVFKGCSSLKTIDLSGWSTSHATEMNELLSGCTNLRTITLGDGFIAPSGTETGYLRKDMFPTPLLTVSDHDSNGKWGFGSEMASTTYTPDELAEHATTAKAMTGTWYAQKIETVTVTLDPNGGGGTPIVITLPKGKATPIPDPTGTDPRLPFEGWSTTPDGSSGVTPSGEPITLTEDTTLYAQWGDNPYLTDAGGIGITSAVALAALSGVLGVLMKRRRK